MEFLFPYPEDSSHNPKDQDPKKLLIERGFIKGYVGLVLEHDDLVYLADWKSDLLLSYDQAWIDRHVVEHYNLQAKLYSLASSRPFRSIRKPAMKNGSGACSTFFSVALSKLTASRPGCLSIARAGPQLRSYEQELKRADRLPRKYAAHEKSD